MCVDEVGFGSGGWRGEEGVEDGWMDEWMGGSERGPGRRRGKIDGGSWRWEGGE